MSRRHGVTLGLAIIVTLSFGIAMAVIHGSGGGIRATIGNLSAPWLLLAFVAGAALGGRRIALGAISGLLVTAIALCAFYIANIWVLGIFGHGALGDLWFALSTGAYYIRLGLFSGPVMGALGALCRQRRSLGLGLAATGLLIFEPIAWFAYQRGELPAGFVPVAAVEVSIGVLVSSVLVVWRRRSSLALRSPIRPKTS